MKEQKDTRRRSENPDQVVRRAIAETRTTIPADDLITLAEVSKLTGLKVKTVNLYIWIDAIPSVKIGHSRRFSRREILEWIDQRDRRRQLRAGLIRKEEAPAVISGVAK